MDLPPLLRVESPYGKFTQDPYPRLNVELVESKTTRTTIVTTLPDAL